MGFSVAVNALIISKAGLPPIAIPADKTTLSPPKLKRNWKVSEGFGIQGAFCVYTGEGLATFDATFEFWNEDKEGAWNLFAALYLTAPTRGLGASGALGIYHPALLMSPLKIDSVQVTEIEGWSLVTPGRWQTRLSFLQYRAPKPFVPAKTEPAVPATTKAPPAKPKDAQEVQIQELTERLKTTVDADAAALMKAKQ